MKSRILVAVVALVASALASCVPTALTPQAPKVSENKSDYVTMPYKKLINAAFLSETNDKFVTMEAYFSQVANDMSTTPEEYRSNFVRFYVKEDTYGRGYYRDFVMLKKNADILFELKDNDKIRVYAKVTQWYRLDIPSPAFVVWKIDKI
jgi:hypothetical protein